MSLRTRSAHLIIWWQTHPGGLALAKHLICGTTLLAATFYLAAHLPEAARSNPYCNSLSAPTLEQDHHGNPPHTLRLAA